MCSLSTQGLPRMASPGPGVPHATSDRTVVEPHLPGALCPPHLSLSLASVSILDSRGGVRPCGVGGSRLEASEAGLGYLNHPGLALPLNPWGICGRGRGAEWGARTPISMLGRQRLRPWDLLGSWVAPALLTVWEVPLEQNLPLHGSTQTPETAVSHTGSHLASLQQVQASISAGGLPWVLGVPLSASPKARRDWKLTAPQG